MKRSAIDESEMQPVMAQVAAYLRPSNLVTIIMQKKKTICVKLSENGPQTLCKKEQGTH